MGKECDLGQQGRRLVAAQAGAGRGAIACAGARIEFGEERKKLVPHRIIEPGNWDRCTRFDVNFRPKQMTAQQLREGMVWLVERLYSNPCIAQRRRPFLEKLWANKAFRA